MAALRRFVFRRPPVTAGSTIVLLLINLAFAWGFQFASRHFPANGPGVIDLQLSMTAGVFRQITGLWGPDNVDIAWWTILALDFLFPITYAALVSGAYVWLCETELLPVRRAVALAPWLAAGFDWIENVLLLWLLADSGQVTATGVRLMSIAAVLKFGLLTVSAGFVIAAFVAGDRGRVLSGARYAVISLLIGTLPLVALDQGRDLLVALSSPSAGWHPFWFITWLVVWAFSVWYWSRILLDADAGADPSPHYTAWARWLPRIAGALTLFVPGLAFGLAAKRALHSTEMYGLGAICILLSAAFLWFVIHRRRLLGLRAGKTATGYSPWLVSRPTSLVLAVSLAVSATMFVWLTFGALSAGRMFGAAPILTIAAANTVFFGCLAVFATRSRRIPIELGALACAAVFSLWNDNHDVRVAPAAPPVRPALADEFRAWIAPLAIDANGEVTVIVAAAEGGGIRAAYWTALVLHTLEGEAPDFSRRLFAISSVSGSSFGAAVYAGLQKDRPTESDRLGTASNVLREKFLAPIVAKLVAGDFLQWFLPWPIGRFDRSLAMEDAFAAAYRSHAGSDTLKQAFLDLRRSATERVPLLFLNGTSVQLGRRIVTSPVHWAPAVPATDGPDPIDMHQLLGADLSVATAVHNTARFPYISPAGRLRTSAGEDLGHIVDGGYFENTGADTLLEVITLLRTIGGMPPIRFVALALINSPPAERDPDEKRVAWRSLDHLGEWFAPVRALLQARTARGTGALTRLKASVGAENFIELRLCNDPQVPGAGRVADPPLAWQLSEEMVAALEAQRTRRCFSEAVARVKDVLRD